MPKKVKEKNSKGKKNTTKVEVSKNEKNTKVVETKKVEKKETAKTVVKKERKKGKVRALFAKVINNTPFAISLCVILLLAGALLAVCVIKRVPKTSDGNDIVATIKGKTFTADELYKNLKENHGSEALMTLIDTYIAEKETKGRITKADEEYVQEVVDYYKEYAEYYKTDFATFLASYMGLSGITTEEEFFDFVLEDYKKTIAIKNFISDEATEEELKNYYKENYSDKLTAKHILIEIDAEAEDKEKAEKEAFEKAQKLIKKLNDTNKDELDKKFEELAKKNSDDTGTFEKGGLIEDFTKKDVVKEFFAAAEKLKNGEYTTEPVKSSYGYHIILKIGSKPVEKYKDIKDEVRSSYAENLLKTDTSLNTTKWDELRKQYKLSIEDDYLKDFYKDSVKNASKQKDSE